jgi:hypothetical protein
MSSYRAYLLRLWADKDAPQRWHFSLEDPHTHSRRGFASLEELVCFLQTNIQADSDLGSNLSGFPKPARSQLESSTNKEGES